MTDTADIAERSFYQEVGALSKMPFEDRQKRYEELLAMQKSGMSLAAIRDALAARGENLSRERVRQILNDPPGERDPDQIDRVRRIADLKKRIALWEARPQTERAVARIKLYKKDLAELE